MKIGFGVKATTFYNKSFFEKAIADASQKDYVCLFCSRFANRQSNFTAIFFSAKTLRGIAENLDLRSSQNTASNAIKTHSSR